jgi:hypothetical protein
MDIRATGDPRFLINMSVLTTPEILEDFVWKTAHVKVYNQKAEWFPALGTAHMAFWWVPIGQIPIYDEGMTRLEALRPTLQAKRLSVRKACHLLLNGAPKAPASLSFLVCYRIFQFLPQLSRFRDVLALTPCQTEPNFANGVFSIRMNTPGF